MSHETINLNYILSFQFQLILEWGGAWTGKLWHSSVQTELRARAVSCLGLEAPGQPGRSGGEVATAGEELPAHFFKAVER